VEANGKQNKDPESTRGTTMEMEEEGERVIAQVKHNQATLFEYMEIS
jgi:hypothetical protein